MKRRPKEQLKAPKKSTAPAAKIRKRIDADKYDCAEWERLGKVLRNPKSSPEKFADARWNALFRLGVEADRRDMLDESDVLCGLMSGEKSLIKEMALLVRKAAKNDPLILGYYDVFQKKEVGRVIVEDCKSFLEYVEERLMGPEFPGDTVPTSAELTVEASSVLAEAAHRANRRVKKMFSIDEAEMRRRLEAHFALHPISPIEDPEQMAKRVLVALGLTKKDADNVLDSADRMSTLRAKRRQKFDPKSD